MKGEGPLEVAGRGVPAEEQESSGDGRRITLQRGSHGQVTKASCRQQGNGGNGETLKSDGGSRYHLQADEDGCG